MKDTAVIATVTTLIVLGIGVMVADAFLLYKKSKEKRKVGSVISDAKKNYSHAILSRELVESFIESLKSHKDKALMIYKSESDPESFVVIIKSIHDETILEVEGEEPVTIATPKNYDKIKKAFEERREDDLKAR